MSGYIGNEPNFQNFARDTFTGDAATTAFTLTSTPGSQLAVLVMISGVVQVPTTDYTVSGTTLTFTSAPPAGTNNIHVIYLGVRGDVATPASATITPAMMSASAGTQTTGKVAVPDSANAQWIWTDYTRLPLNINPNWLLDQINEGTLYTVTGGGAITQGPDGWSGFGAAAPGVFKMRTLADPDNAALKCLEVTCTTADAAIAAGDAYYVYTDIEGYDSADLKPGTAAASQITVQFKSKFTPAGTYGISVINSALNRSYVGTFTQAVAGAEEDQKLTLTLDTSGTWLYTSGTGLRVRICLAAGSTFQTTAGSWQAGNLFTTSAQANFMSANTNIGYIKRFHVIPGGVALAYSSQDFQRELAKAQRHYWKSFRDGTAVAGAVGTDTGELGYTAGFAGTSTNYSPWFAYKTRMRANAAVTIYNPAVNNNQVRNEVTAVDCSATAGLRGSPEGFSVSCTGDAGAAIGHFLGLHATANARLS